MAGKPLPGSHADKIGDKADRTPRRMEPPVTELTQPFWEATREHRFLLQWCVDCDAAQYFPRDICLACGGSHLEWREASGDGVVYALTVENKPMNPAINERRALRDRPGRPGRGAPHDDQRLRLPARRRARRACPCAWPGTRSPTGATWRCSNRRRHDATTDADRPRADPPVTSREPRSEP